MAQSSDRSSPDLGTTEVVDVNVNVEPSFGVTTRNLRVCCTTGKYTSLGPAFDRKWHAEEAEVMPGGG